MIWAAQLGHGGSDAVTGAGSPGNRLDVIAAEPVFLIGVHEVAYFGLMYPDHVKAAAGRPRGSAWPWPRRTGHISSSPGRNPAGECTASHLSP
jgi:hypothetical protein